MALKKLINILLVFMLIFGFLLDNSYLEKAWGSETLIENLPKTYVTNSEYIEELRIVRNDAGKVLLKLKPVDSYLQGSYTYCRVDNDVSYILLDDNSRIYATGDGEEDVPYYAILEKSHSGYASKSFRVSNPIFIKREWFNTEHKIVNVVNTGSPEGGV